MRPHLEKPFTKIGLVEWLKVKALSSSPSTKKRKQKQMLYGSTYIAGVAKLRDRKYNVFAKGKGKGKVGEFNGYRL
jgi:hypothetical protein